MFEILIGNIFSLIATGFTILNGTRKKKRDMLICDMGAAISFTISDFVLKGYSGVVQNVVGLLRNLVTLYIKNSQILGWILVMCGVVFGVYFNNHGFIGLLPVASCFYYSICVINPNVSPRTLKFALILSNLSFGIYCIVLWNVVGVVTNSITVITTLISYLKNEEEN